MPFRLLAVYTCRPNPHQAPPQFEPRLPNFHLATVILLPLIENYINILINK